jgi:hypothetical protein
VFGEKARTAHLPPAKRPPAEAPLLDVLRTALRRSHATVSVGAAARSWNSWNWVSDELRTEYGDSPRSVLFFVQFAIH